MPSGVLWLLSSAEAVNQRLREAATQIGIAPERIVFAPSKGNLDHVARYPLADLFLDTWPYGAHTTASDALWMGVPVITFPGLSFASRVCGSLVRAAGVGDLVCDTPQQYVERAVELGNDRAKTQAYKDKLAGNKGTNLLFDTPKLVDHLESVFERMWEEFADGRLPRPELTNLDVYQDVGIEEDVDPRTPLTNKEYQDRYLRKLACRDALYPLSYDHRLWTSEAAKRSWY